jgi:flavorubredoxin
LEQCPRAQLVSSWAINERHANAFAFPLDRCRWINDGDCFDIGDRKLIAVRPPTYDSPATRGLFDPRTGVYWAVDCFATPIPGDATVSTFATDVGDLDPDFWWHGTTMFVLNALSPWVKLVDRDKFAATVARVRDLQPQTIVAAHSPVITSPSIERALSQTSNLVDVELPPIPDDSALQHLLAAIQPGPLPEAVNGAVSTAALRDGVPQLR